MKQFAEYISSFENILPISCQDEKRFCTFIESMGSKEDNENFGHLFPSILTKEYVRITLSPQLRSLIVIISLMDEASGSQPVLINVSQTRVVYTALELLWTLAIRNSILKESKSELIDDSLPVSLIIPHSLFPFLRSLDIDCSTAELFDYIDCIYAIVSHDHFVGMMLNRYIDRFLLVYLYLLRHTAEEDPLHYQAEERLEQMISISPWKSLIISRLKSFASQSSALWLRKLSSSYITKILLLEVGIEAVIVGYLDGLLDSPYFTSIQVQLAKSLAIIPAKLKAEEYLHNVIQRQWVMMWERTMQSKDEIMQKTLVLILVRCLQMHSKIIQEIFFQTYFQPLYTLITGEITNSNNTGNEESLYIHPRYLLANRQSVGRCLWTLQKLVLLSPPLSFLARVLYQCKLVDCLLYLYIEIIHQQEMVSMKVQSKSPTTSNDDDDHVKIWLPKVIAKIVSMNIDQAAETIYRLCTPERQQLAGKFVIASDCSSIEIHRREDDHNSHPTILDNNDIAIKSTTAIKNNSHIAVPSSSSSSSSNNHNGGLVGDDDRDDNNGEEELNRTILQTEEGRRIQLVCQMLLSISTIGNVKTSVGKTAQSKDPSSSCTSLIISKFFYHVLSNYLQVSTNTASNTVDVATKTSTAVSNPAQIGMVLMIAIQTLPMEYILQDGGQILAIIQLIIAQSIASLEEHAFDSSSSSMLPSSSSKKQPLVTEISDTGVGIGTDDAAVSNVKVNATDESEVNKASLLKIAVTLLSSILAFGNAMRDEKDEKMLQSLRESLQKLAWLSQEEETSDIARELAHANFARQLTNNDSLSKKTAVTLSISTPKEFVVAVQSIRQEYLLDDSPAIRAYGVNQFSMLLLTNYYTISKHHLLQVYPSVLQECFYLLADIDSFVYLNNVLLICKLQKVTQDASLLYTLLYHFTVDEAVFFAVFPESIQQTFIAPIQLLPLHITKSTDPSSSSGSSSVHATLRWRAMIGECIQQILRKKELNFMTNDQSTILLGIIALCIRICKDRTSDWKVEDKSSIDEGETGDAGKITEVDIFSGRRRKDHEKSDMKKSPESTEQNVSADEGTEEEGEQSSSLSEATIMIADRLYYRQSAFSILGEAVTIAGTKIVHYLLDIIDIAAGVLTLEASFGDVDRAMRRAAIFILRYIVDKYSVQLFTHFGADGMSILKRILHISKLRGIHDKDEVVKFQAGQLVQSLKATTLSLLALND